MIRTAFAALALLAPLPLAAQTVTGDAAAAMLFAPQPAEVEIVKDVLPKDQAKMLAMVAKDQPYYAAIAISPDEGLMSEATMAAANHHTVEAAVAAVLASSTLIRSLDCGTPLPLVPSAEGRFPPVQV